MVESVMVLGKLASVLLPFSATHVFLFITYAEVNAGCSVALSGAPSSDLFSSKGVSDSSKSQLAVIKQLARRLPHRDLLPRSVFNYSFYFQEDLCCSASQDGFCLDVLRRTFGTKF